MRDEQARRRPEFLAGVGVRLADGQVWSLPVRDELACTLDLNQGRGDATYRTILDSIVDADGPAEIFLAELALAIHLLDLNYVLEPDDFEELLDDRGDRRCLEELQGVLHGLAASHSGRLTSLIDHHPEKVKGPRCDEFRRLISQATSRVFGRLGHRRAGSSADMTA